MTIPPRPPRRGFFAGLRASFLTGLVVVAPAVLTLWLIRAFVEFVDSRVVPLIPVTWLPEPLENLRILEEENIVGHVKNVAAPHLKEAWSGLPDHPLVGEAKICGLMASIALTPDKSSRARFASDPGTVGLICREHSFALGLIMRHVGDRMVISPPLIIQPVEIDLLITRVRKALDLTLADLREQGLLKAAS